MMARQPGPWMRCGRSAPLSARRWAAVARRLSPSFSARARLCAPHGRRGHPQLRPLRRPARQARCRPRPQLGRPPAPRRLVPAAGRLVAAATPARTMLTCLERGTTGDWRGQPTPACRPLLPRNRPRLRARCRPTLPPCSAGRPGRPRVPPRRPACPPASRARSTTAFGAAACATS
jgi:hypothetical protein